MVSRNGCLARTRIDREKCLDAAVKTARDVCGDFSSFLFAIGLPEGCVGPLLNGNLTVSIGFMGVGGEISGKEGLAQKCEDKRINDILECHRKYNCEGIVCNRPEE
jgi:hypothetical protein